MENVQTFIAWAVKKVQHARIAVVTTRYAATAQGDHVSVKNVMLRASALIVLPIVVVVTIFYVIIVMILLRLNARIVIYLTMNTMSPLRGAMPAFQVISRHANNVKKHFVILGEMVAKYVTVTTVRRSYVWIAPTYVSFAKILCVANAAILPLAPMMFVII